MVIALSAESVFQSAKWSKPIEVGDNAKRLPKNLFGDIKFKFMLC